METGTGVLPEPPKTRFIGWKLLGVLCFIYCINMLVPLYGAGVLSNYMSRDLGMSGSATGWMFAVYMLMGGLPGPLSPGVSRSGAPGR